ncbi:protein SpAN-like protein [Aphelenchoides avenae]|nr:protein SpAN-like protein [Aphelenchus avenae]
MAIRLLALVLAIVTPVAHCKLINYYFHETNNRSINECILGAMSKLMRETCLEFRHFRANDAILFIGSGHCRWQAGNSTVHLGSDCVTEEHCANIVSGVLMSSTNKPYPFVTRELNLKYNCSDKCTILCENGGTVTNDCTCECAYGFTGDRCTDLAKSSKFTDSSCGIREGETEGTITLSTYPNAPSGATFCQWLIRSPKPWDMIEIEFEELDLDNEDLLPGRKCNDDLFVAGSDQISQPIPCNREKSSVIGRRFNSTSNWLLVELRMNQWSRRRHSGPVINYSVISPANHNALRSFSLEQFGNSSASALPSIATIVFLLIVMVVRH